MLLRRRTVAPAVAAAILTLGLSACGAGHEHVVPAAHTNTVPQQPPADANPGPVAPNNGPSNSAPSGGGSAESGSSSSSGGSSSSGSSTTTGSDDADGTDTGPGGDRGPDYRGGDPRHDIRTYDHGPDQGFRDGRDNNRGHNDHKNHSDHNGFPGNHNTPQPQPGAPAVTSPPVVPPPTSTPATSPSTSTPDARHTGHPDGRRH